MPRILIVLLALLLALPAMAQAPGAVLRDCAECPEMVVVPAGYTRLASGGNVRIEEPFLVGKFEVTLEEYDTHMEISASPGQSYMNQSLGSVEAATSACA